MEKTEKMPFDVTLFGRPLSEDRYTWDSNTKTFTSSANNLIVSACRGLAACDCITFKLSGSHCAFFGLGSHCEFEAGAYCIFEVDGHCSFNVGNGCTIISTSGDCEIQDAGIQCSVIYMEIPKSGNLNINPSTYMYNLGVKRTWYLDADGILTEVKVPRVGSTASVQVSVGGESLTIDVTLTSDQLAFVQNKVKQLKVEA